MRQSKKLKQFNRILKSVRNYKEKMASLSDEELAHLTLEFKERLKDGETLDDILPEAYAAICEADYRVLGKFPYDVQVLGGIAIHQGNLIEMNTGEGKTLMATLPLYLNALTGKSAILLTTNEYLVLRDAEEMGRVYNFMGLSIAAGVPERPDMDLSNEDKKRIYQADIVYTTHGGFGFDYLLNNLVVSANDRFLRELNFVIIDEADSVLLDGSQTPLVISGVPRVQSNLYFMADFFVTTLIEGKDYILEDKKVWLTEEGIRYTEQYFQIDNFYSSEHFEINRHVTLALRAHKLFEIEKEYMISKDGELHLLDNGSGRMMSGVKLRGGQHQALEVKEKIVPSRENRSMASITYQNLFNLFPKMSGMSGTISDAAEELKEVYGTDVVVIPPNCPVCRKDLPDIYFRDNNSQFNAAIKVAVDTHKTGQPVLIVASTIGETEVISALLMREKIPHNVLNANNAFWEAEIIKEAGQLNAMTVATAMAGRGTDIKLGEGVRELGGLAVVGIGRMMNARQERQARGRAGRQGDPGFSRFFVSLQDEVVQSFGPSSLDKFINAEKKISKNKIKKIVNLAQKIGEESAIMSRKGAMDYDIVLRRQRALIYDTRNQLLDGGTLAKARFLEIVTDNISSFIRSKDSMNKSDVNRFVLDNISYKLDDVIKNIDCSDYDELFHYMMMRAEESLKLQEKSIANIELINRFMREATLQAIDSAWVEQVDYLQQLRNAVSGRTFAQRNPIFEYQRDALESFEKMKRNIYRDIMRNILLSEVQVNEEENLIILYP